MKFSIVKYLFAFLILSSVLSCSNDDSSSKEIPNEISVADEVFKLVNEYRSEKGLKPLTRNSTAEELAIDHTRYMISKKDISHDNFNDRGDVLNEKENAVSTAENVASFYPDAKSVVAGWINSDGHRQNIEGDYTHTGVAAIKDESGKYYYTQLFYR